MMIRLAMTAAAIAAILAAAPATAQSTTAVTDGEIAQCVVAMTAATKLAKTPDQKASINGVMLYFIGKLSARHSPAEVKALLAAGDKESSSLDLMAVGRACAKEVADMGAAL